MLSSTRKAKEPRIEIGGEYRDGQSIYFVRDIGVRFPSGDATKVFRPFGRLHPSDEFEGTGLGLATVRRIIEHHGGKVRAEGNPVKGAIFCFRLPDMPKAETGGRPAGSDGS